MLEVGSHLGRSTPPAAASSRGCIGIPRLCLLLRCPNLEETFLHQMILACERTSPPYPASLHSGFVVFVCLFVCLFVLFCFFFVVCLVGCFCFCFVCCCCCLFVCFVCFCLFCCCCFFWGVGGAVGGVGGGGHSTGITLLYAKTVVKKESETSQ